MTEALTFPCGYLDKEGTLHREFELQETTGQATRRLGEKGVRRNSGKAITVILEHCLTRVGEITDVTDGLVRELLCADRDYAMLMVRRTFVGPQLTLTKHCDGCDLDFDTDLDLDDIPVKRLENPEEREFVVELRAGLTDREGQRHTKATMRLPTGADQEIMAPKMRGNTVEASYLLLSRCIKSLGSMTRVSVVDIERMVLSDIHRLEKALAEHSPGPELVQSFECPECGRALLGTVDVSDFLVTSQTGKT